MAQLFVEYVSIIILGLLPIMNPFSTTPLFLSLTRSMTAEKQRQQALRACIYAFCILVIFLLMGNIIIDAFGISIAGIRVAGGLVILSIGYRMIFAASVMDPPPAGGMASNDVAFTPLAMPSLGGPGAIAVILGFGSEIPKKHLILGHVIVIIRDIHHNHHRLSGITGLHGFRALSGEGGLTAMTKIMGFILTCVAVQFIFSGVRDFILLSQT